MLDGEKAISRVKTCPSQAVVSMFMELRPVLRLFLINRLKGEADAEDVLQEVYLRLSEIKIEDCIKDERAFLFKMARNLAIDFQRRKAVRRAQPLDDKAIFEVPSATPSPEVQAISREWYARFSDAIDEMPTKRKQVFVLHKMRQLSYREIADKMGISTKMVEKHMTQALSHCRKRLSDVIADLKV